MKHIDSPSAKRSHPETCGFPESINVLLPRNTSMDFKLACNGFLRSRGLDPGLPFRHPYPEKPQTGPSPS